MWKSALLAAGFLALVVSVVFNFVLSKRNSELERAALPDENCSLCIRYHTLVCEMKAEIAASTSLQVDAYGGFRETKAFPKLVELGKRLIPLLISDLIEGANTYQLTVGTEILTHYDPAQLKHIREGMTILMGRDKVREVWLKWWYAEGKDLAW